MRAKNGARFSCCATFPAKWTTCFVLGLVVAFCVSCRQTTSDDEALNGEQLYSSGLKYATGDGVPQDYVKAVELFQKAAVHDNAMAQFSLGYAYQAGLGVTQNCDEAVKWYRKSAEQNNRRAELNLGVLYAKGLCLTQNITEATHWYQKSADHGEAQAQLNLGYWYHQGIGVTQDFTKSVLLLRQAANQGLPNAQAMLGVCYAMGHGVTQDVVEALAWMGIAASSGDGEYKQLYDNSAASLTTQQLAEVQWRRSKIVIDSTISPMLRSQNQLVHSVYTSLTDSAPAQISTSQFACTYFPGDHPQSLRTPTTLRKFLISLMGMLTAVGLITTFVNIWMTDEQKRPLKQRFEAWWLTVQYLDREQFAVIVAAQVLDFLDSFFGVRILSLKYLLRSSCMSVGLVIAMLTTVGLFNGEIVGIAPWATYTNTMSWVKTNWEPLKQKFSNPKLSEKEIANLHDQFDKIKERILRYDTPTWRITYSAIVFSGLAIVGSCLFPLSLAISRRMLREIVLTKRTFTSFCLLVTNVTVTGAAAGVALIILEVLAVPVLWKVAPQIISLAWALNGALVLMVFGIAIPVAWAFTSPAIKAVVVIAFLPCGITFVVTALTLTTLGFRHKVHKLLSAILLRCEAKGLFAIIGAFLALVLGLIAVIAKWSTWSF